MKLFTMTITVLFITIILFAQNAFAQVKIVTSVPDFAAIARDIGGDKVEVVSLAKGYQDPHFVDAKPVFVTKLNQADLVIYNGLELEAGWLPLLITGARNSEIAAGNAVGHYDVSLSIKNKLDVHSGPVDRSRVCGRTAIARRHGPGAVVACRGLFGTRKCTHYSPDCR